MSKARPIPKDWFAAHAPPTGATAVAPEVLPSHEAILMYVRGLNLAGFELFDETNRYEVDFPKGW
jgi:hypothetical protein